MTTFSHAIYKLYKMNFLYSKFYFYMWIYLLHIGNLLHDGE